MKYVGLQQQIARNNVYSILLLLGFPILILAATYTIVYFTSYDEVLMGRSVAVANETFINAIPFVLAGVAVWFLIAYFFNSKMIEFTSGSHTLERSSNMRVYNLTENLCMSVGMKMPKLQIIESNALNAFASGISEKTYTVTITRGLMERLDDKELEGVIAHELMHIRNKDVRLLIVSLIFVGIFSIIVQSVFRGILYGAMGGGNRKRDDKDGGGGGAMIVILIVSVVAYFISLLFKLALSRKREYMADSGAVQMTKDPLALASALRKISGNSNVSSVKNDDIKEMFIDNPPNDSMGFLGGLGGLFSTHPPIEKRIQILEQF